MCTRGIYQLKNIKLTFCDWGGSSRGARDFLKSAILKDFLEKNPQISVDFLLKRGSHPFISSTYINGYNKSQSLRNMEPEDILNEFQRVRQSFGRKHLPHAGKKVHGAVKSVQGGWKPNMWNMFPKHELEKIKIIPEFNEKVIEYENKRFTDPTATYQKDYLKAILKPKGYQDIL